MPQGYLPSVVAPLRLIKPDDNARPILPGTAEPLQEWSSKKEF